nr:hypothetical protein [Providencia sneebia]
MQSLTNTLRPLLVNIAVIKMNVSAQAVGALWSLIKIFYIFSLINILKPAYAMGNSNFLWRGFTLKLHQFYTKQFVGIKTLIYWFYYGILVGMIGFEPTTPDTPWRSATK